MQYQIQKRGEFYSAPNAPLPIILVITNCMKRFYEAIEWHLDYQVSKRFGMQSTPDNQAA
jgi:hypothetical protein